MFWFFCDQILLQWEVIWWHSKIFIAFLSVSTFKLEQLLNIAWTGYVVPQATVQPPMCYDVCDNACKRSLAICRKSRALCPVSRVGLCVLLAGFCLSLYGLHVLNRDVNMIQTKWQATIGWGRLVSAPPLLTVKSGFDPHRRQN